MGTVSFPPMLMPAGTFVLGGSRFKRVCSQLEAVSLIQFFFCVFCFFLLARPSCGISNSCHIGITSCILQHKVMGMIVGRMQFHQASDDKREGGSSEGQWYPDNSVGAASLADVCKRKIFTPAQ